ncbi:MAG: acetyl-CoA carboxylase biotin carboxyl carrier protein [Tissierellia bacterium]|jgi:acetyl-CoA carboxylase biotin carboxyl carrier protein|nr:acetyl-CoA carboxylase biotin carboxyl carrier protein [Tissierellia bacterium]
MDLDKIKAILELFEESKISKLEVEDENLRIAMEKGGGQVTYTLSDSSNTIQADVAQKIEEAPVLEEPSGYIVKAPLVGTFYTAPSPGARPFVEVGQKVSAGDVLCILEAMKMLNEIKSPVSGTVKKVLAINGDLIGYEDELFEIEEL